MNNSKLLGVFSELLKKFETVSSVDIDEVGENIGYILTNIFAYEGAPKFLVSRALYVDELDNSFSKGKFVVRPTIKYKLTVKDMHYSFILINSATFYVDFILEVLNWIARYNECVELEGNLKKFNARISEIIKESQYPYELMFAIGDGIVDVSDNSLVLGLTLERVKSLGELALFSTNDYWKQTYIDKFLNVLKECNRPYDFVKIKSDITDELGVYTRKSITKLIRKVVTRRIDYVRVGVGYNEDSKSFAVIEKKAVSPSDIVNYSLLDCVIGENICPTTTEKADGLMYIVTQFKLSPYDKLTTSLLDVNISDYMRKITKKKKESDNI